MRADRILYLLESSLPYAPSGYGYRSRELLRALREAGLRPEVATRMGFPSSRGIMGAPAEETVDGVTHHRLNLPGVSKYTGIPLDERLQQNAEWLLELVDRIEPGGDHRRDPAPQWPAGPEPARGDRHAGDLRRSRLPRDDLGDAAGWRGKRGLLEAS